MEKFTWALDKYDIWNLRVYNVHLWIQRRPWYCDRGHYQGQVDGVHWLAHLIGLPDIDEADVFPRYFMNLERAKLEMREWLIWRLNCLERTNPQAFEDLKAQGPSYD